jgi:hypothetical protein
VSEPLADVIARMQARYRPHAASPVRATRKPTDTPPPAGLESGYGAANSLSSRRRGGTYPNTYRPGAKDYAGMAEVSPPTTRPAYGSVKPSGGIRVTRNMPLEPARATGEDNGFRMRAQVRRNTAEAAGEMYSSGTRRTR